MNKRNCIKISNKKCNCKQEKSCNKHCNCEKPCECNHCNSCNSCNTQIECVQSNWSEFKPLNCKDSEIFYEAIRGIVGCDFSPLIVSTKIHDGYNYLFLAEKTIPGSCEKPSLVYVKICVMHCGIIKLVDIKIAHLYPQYNC